MACRSSRAPSPSDVSTETPATRFLQQHGVAFTLHPYEYEERGGTRVSSQKLGVEEHAVIKTLVFEDEARQPLLVLMHGDKQVSARQLARQLGVKTVQPCKPEVAQRHTGYLVGGTSPFGTKKSLRVCCERSITTLPALFINAGKRGLLCTLAPSELVRVLSPTLVDCASER
ncbi:MAG: Cys-tRNA(Pro) deacylase [Archangium gephyra]|uniref:Cys-tRNA(Pro)/Cys-tRNA(Cys) deacylase n=1 Tax=Archangium gephyra TaxID=48 RepID=A0A2W5TI96_9BACT|nr:MAG: Cys-tRNA(Pro) deacylase [Archangium gephyra]